MRNLYIIIFILAFQFSSHAKDNRTLLTIDNNSISVNDFIRVYDKNNFDKAADYSEQSLNEYIELFIQYKLKLLEAQKMGIGDNVSVRDEYNTYTQQLYNNYFDKKKTNVLIQEVYDRMQFDVAISHIFIKLTESRVEDEKKINTIYSKLLSGEKFEEVAKKYSEDSYSAPLGGFLGYFTGMQISLPELEDAAFSTEVDSYTKPFRTNAGYHILKVNDKRPAVGKIKISIIKKIKIKDDIEQNKKAELEINKLYQKLEAGEDFSSVAKEFSEDVYSKESGGELDWFGISTYALDFENVAFSLKKKGDLSKPFETTYAWYIIKLNDHLPPPSLNEIYTTIKTHVFKSLRFENEKNKHTQEILEKYGYEELNPNFSTFKQEFINRLTNQEKILFVEAKNPQELIKIVGTTYNENDLGNYISRYINRSISISPTEKFNELLKEFIQEKAIGFHKEKLGEEDEEYGILLKEYMEGILLFDVMGKKVWNKAIEDTAGQRAFYMANNQNYVWEEKAVIDKYIMNTTSLKYFKKQLSKKSSFTEEQWNKILAKKGIQTNEIVTKEISSTELSKYGLSKQENTCTTKTLEDGVDEVTVLSKIIPQRQKTFQEARGFVTADFQKYIELEWIKELKGKYKVSVNQEVFKSLIKN